MMKGRSLLKKEELKKKLEQISTENFKSFRVLNSYDEVHDLISLITCIKDDLKAKYLQDLIDVEKRNQLRTLLESLYVFSDIFINVFLQEILNKRDDQNSTRNMLKEYYERLAVPDKKQEKFLPAFCIVSYRNKIVVHQDQYRANAYGIDADGKIKLISFEGPFETSFDENKTNKVKELKKKYLQEIPDLSQIENGPTLLTTLFYNVPVYHGNQFNKDRVELNKLIETGGCESYNDEQLIEHIDDFINTICQTHIYLNEQITK